jgi:hypothetical protein
MGRNERYGQDAPLNMPTYRISIVNKHFRASDEHELASHEAAVKEALQGALQIGADEVCGGAQFFGAEVGVECDGEVFQRLVIAIGASALG